MAQSEAASAPAEPLLRLRGMAKDFPGVRALDGVDLDIAAGEVHALVGENGAGKSTLMNVVGGIITDYDGEMSLDGRPLRLRGPRDADRLGIRVIHQELTLVPPMTVAENICLGQEECGLAGLGVSRSCVRQRAAAILDDLGFDLPLEAPVEALGTGQQQLVEVAHAFAREMRVLILDEPTAALVPADVDRLFRVLKDLRARGLAIVYISHRLAELPRIADRVTVLRDGRVVGTYQTGDVSMAEVARLMMGRDLREAFPERRAPGHDVLMSVRGLSLPGRLHDISFDLRAGEILGLAGLVGAGRTELLRCLFGAEAVAAKVEVAGGQAVVRSPRDARRLGLALVPEDRRGQGLVLGRPVAENLALTTMTRLAPRGFLGRRRLMDYARDLIARFKVSPPDPSAEVGNLSGGNQQKVAIAKWVATAPRVYLFDEPTRGLDVGARAEVYRLIADLAAEGHGVIVVSSEVPEVIGLAHRVLVLCGGRIAAEMNAAGATEDAVLAVCAGDASAA